DRAAVGEAVTALRVAIAETPRRTGMSRTVNTAVAETIRQSVAAVRACDAAAVALVGVLDERMGAGRGRAQSRPEPAAPTQRPADPARAGAADPILAPPPMPMLAPMPPPRVPVAPTPVPVVPAAAVPPPAFPPPPPGTVSPAPVPPPPPGITPILPRRD